MADYFAEYLALKETNDRLREQGRAWIWESVSRHSAEINTEMAALPPGPTNQSPQLPGLQLGRQDWRLVGRSGR
jgi:hypothetical protein